MKTHKAPYQMTLLKWAVMLCITCYFIANKANAEPPQEPIYGVIKESTPNIEKQVAHLKVTPKRCIALRKGQKCYLEVTFNWQHPKVNDYCLVNTTTNKTMKCWQQQTQGKFNFDFQSTLSNDFALRSRESPIDLAHAQIPVAWVYKSSKRAKSTWRLF